MRLKCNNGLQANAERIQYEAVAHYLRMLFIMVYLVDPSDWKWDYFCGNDGEEWYSADCPYCKEYYCVTDELQDDQIESNCPLGVSSRTCCDTRWAKMNQSKTWGAWVFYAHKVLEYIIIHGQEVRS